MVNNTPAAITTITIGNFGASFLATTITAREQIPSTTETGLICDAASIMETISSGSSPVPELPPSILGIYINMIVTAIPLIKPPITGVDM